MNDDQFCAQFEQSLSLSAKPPRFGISLYELSALICKDFEIEDVIKKETSGTFMNVSIDFPSGVMAQVVPNCIIFYIAANVDALQRQKLSLQFLSLLPDHIEVDYLWTENDSVNVSLSRPLSAQTPIRNSVLSMIRETNCFLNIFQIGIALFDNCGKMLLEQDILHCFLLAEQTFGHHAQCTVSECELNMLPTDIKARFRAIS